MPRAGARYLSLNEQEIAAWVQRAQIVDGKILESGELRTLRRNMAYSFVDCDVLTIASDELGAPVEWPFLLRSGAAILDALVIIWSAADPDDLKLARADWVLKNLYVPDRGRSFTNAERSGPADLQLEAAVLAGFLVGSFAVQAWRQDKRQNRRQFLNWIYGSLIRDRFDADPGLARITVEIAKRLLLQSVDGMPGKDKRIAGVLATLLKAWLEDLPDALRDVFGKDSAFCSQLGVSILAMVQMGAHKIAPEKFWDGAVQALRTNATVEVNSDSGNLHVQIASSSGQTYLVVEDRSAMQRFELRDVPVGILSDSITERSAALTSIASQFDLRRSAAQDAVARLAQIVDTGQRMEELFALRRRSLELMYLALFGKLRVQEGVTISDFVPEESALATQHLRIDQQPVGGVPFSTKLESAGSTLLDDLGLTQALLRLMSLPVPLPPSVLTRLAEQSPTERRQTFRSLIRQIGGSPIATAHLIRLIGSFASDRPSYSRYRKLKLEKLDRIFDATPGEAWLEVLKYFAREFWYVNGFRSLEKDIRLAVVWSHADSIFRVMAQARVDLAWIHESAQAIAVQARTNHLLGTELLAVGPDVVCVGDVESIGSTQWTLRLRHFVLGDIHQLSGFIGHFDTLRTEDRYILSNELGDGRSLSHAPTLTKRSGEIILACPIVSAAPRLDVHKIGSMSAMHPETNDLYAKDGQIARVSGLEAFPQILRSALSMQRGENVFAPHEGMRFFEYFEDFRGSPWLSRLMMLDVVREASIPASSIPSQEWRTPLPSITRVLKFQLLSETPEAQRLPVHVALDV